MKKGPVLNKKYIIDSSDSEIEIKNNNRKNNHHDKETIFVEFIKEEIDISDNLTAIKDTIPSFYTLRLKLYNKF